MNFLLYLLGSAVLISGAAWIASALGAAPTMITVSAAILLAAAAALGVSAFARTARRS
jgi:apolipoprotein N-acyltransferase